MSDPGLTTTPKAARRAALGSFVGAVVEWYDFLLYGIVAATVFGPAFFPELEGGVGVLAAFATFGVGFLARPIGGVIFGHFGDKLGRKRMLVWTMTLMGIATATIGFLPTYDVIGWWAPALLVALRLLQGVAVGGEWGGASLMAVESAPKKRKALYSSGVQVGYCFGLIIATGFVLIVSSLLGDTAFESWGWRIPFLFSAVLVAVALWVRAGVPESTVFEESVADVAAEPVAKRRLPFIEAFTSNPKAFASIIALRLAELFTMYIVTTFALSYATKEFDFSRDFMLELGLLVGVVAIVTIPAFAWLSDRFGPRPVYLGGAAVGVVGTVPFFLALESGSAILVILAAVLLVNVAHDAIVSVQQPLFNEMFDVRHRYSGAGVGYQVASALAGGLTPFIATGLVLLAGNGWYLVALYLGAGCALSFVVGWFTIAKVSTAPDRDNDRDRVDAIVRVRDNA